MLVEQRSSNMMWTRNLSLRALLLLVVASATALPQQQQRQPPQQQQRQPPQQQQQRQPPQPQHGGNLSQPTGDIDSISSDTDFVSLEPASIQRFLNNEKSVNTLTRCYINKAQCTSSSSLNLMNQIAALSAAGGQCTTCDPAARQKTLQLVAMLVKGLSERYPQQWQHILPNIRPLVQALQQNTG